MLKSYWTKDAEFEKNKKAILKRIEASNANIPKIGRNITNLKEENKKQISHRYVWEYEIEEYKRRKNKERLYLLGALSGVISLVITVAVNYHEMGTVILTIIKFIKKVFGNSIIFQ
ncbi:MAG: hypothetical protein PWQ37_1773 [Candidatus Petromonas sp.]|nr:hypothetical protein [Candidatus Petromonas sp.]